MLDREDAKKGRARSESPGATEFCAPPWEAPLDVNECFAAIPSKATMKGLCLAPMVTEAKRRGITLRGARDRYLPFVDYPLVEHARLLVESARAFFPALSMRQALRKIGRAAQKVAIETVVGKVLWAGVEDVEHALESTVRSYAVSSPSTRVTLLEHAPGRARVRLDRVSYFLDSHHVGVFEAAMRVCQVKGTVFVRLDTLCDGEFLVTWDPPRAAR